MTGKIPIQADRTVAEIGPDWDWNHQYRWSGHLIALL